MHAQAVSEVLYLLGELAGCVTRKWPWLLGSLERQEMAREWGKCLKYVGGCAAKY